MKKIALLLLLFVPGVTVGQQVDLSIKGDGVRVVKVDKVIVVKEDATVVQSFPFTVNAPAGAGLYFWTFPSGVVAIDKGDALDVQQAAKGPLTVSVKAISADVDKDGKFKGFKTTFGSVSFTIGDVPQPPGPGPNPPTPDPVTPAPIPLAGYRVLFIEETEDRNKITLDQFNVMFSADSANWLNANAKEWRVYDKDSAALSDTQLWRDALKRRPATFATPWVIISNGVTGYEGPLPKTGSEIKTLLQKYVPTGGGR